MSNPSPQFADIIRLHGRWRAAHPAVCGPDASLSWQEFDRATNRVANGLIAAGCTNRARVGVVMDNSAAMAVVLFGIVKSGAVAVPLNTSVSDAAISAMLADAGVAGVFASPAHVGRIGAEIVQGCTVCLVDGVPPTPPWKQLSDWQAAAPPDRPDVHTAPDDVCNIIYSSGTTGAPKGIMHTHGSRVDWAGDLALALRYDSAARTLIATGLYSNISWATMLPTVLLGGTLIIEAGFDAGRVLHTIARQQVSHTAMVPVQFQRILDHPDFDRSLVSSMRAMMSCGSPLPVGTKTRLLDEVPGGVVELYGATEGVVTTLPPEEAKGRLASVGRPLPGEDIQLLGDDDGVVPEGEPGEIVALSRFVMAGYWNRPEATEAAFWTDDAGRRWLRSGDIGRIDEDGYLYITDRKKDMILSGGQNVYPADIEAVLIAHEDVFDCAVFGIPSEAWGETPLALVVLKSGSVVSAQDMLAWANGQLGKQQRLHAVELRDALPRNANGKLLKRDLRAPYWEAAQGMEQVKEGQG